MARRNHLRVVLGVLVALLATAMHMQASRAQTSGAPPTLPPPDPTRAPPGHEWWCLDMPSGSDVAVCARTEPLCRGLVSQFPWGGMPPGCVRLPGPAACITWPIGSARRTGSRCFRDQATCTHAWPAWADRRPTACGLVP